MTACGDGTGVTTTEVLDMDIEAERDRLAPWIGRSETATEALSTEACRKLQHTLDRDATLCDGDPLPPLWHFISHVRSAPLHELGRDGHPRTGGFMPPSRLPRRMWAGGRFAFHGVLRLGEAVRRTSRIAEIQMKRGRSGPLCFVTVEHTFAVDGDVRLIEQRDIVYRDDPGPTPHAAPHAAPQSAPPPALMPEADIERLIEPGAVMLFRYSGLTFNGHRIHYDRDYARDVEGYPGLVVHGPLIATLLADLATHHGGRPLRHFAFRALAPLFDTAPFRIAGRRDGDRYELWATGPDDRLAMRASAELATNDA